MCSVIVATYTANLAAYLTLHEEILEGPQSLPQLAEATVCVLLHTDAKHVEGLVKDAIVPKVQGLHGVDLRQRLVECTNLVHRGEAVAVMVEDIFLRGFELDNCDTFGVTPNLRNLVSSVNQFIMSKKRGDNLVDEVGKAMYQVVSSKGFEELQVRFFQTDKSCEVSSQSEQIDAHQLDGLFVIMGVTATLAILMAVANRLLVKFAPARNRRRHKLTNAERLDHMVIMMEENEKRSQERFEEIEKRSQQRYEESEMRSQRRYEENDVRSKQRYGALLLRPREETTSEV